MKRIVQLSAALLALSQAACGGEAGGSLEATLAQPITGGQLADDPSVFFLKIAYGPNAFVTCSAALIGQRVLLTAAHCVDPAMRGGATLTISANNQTYAKDAPAKDFIPVVDTLLHPLWHPSLAADPVNGDIAVVALAQVPRGVTPLRFADGARPPQLETQTGATVRILGYGVSDVIASGITGIKRDVTLSLEEVRDSQLRIGDGVEQGVCYGDSGGPTVLRFPDGQDRVIGVHSRNLMSCVDGLDTRVDYYAEFVAQAVEQLDAPACVANAHCEPDCGGEDPDCPTTCPTDGQCNVLCGRFDRDCPAEGCSQAGGLPAVLVLAALALTALRGRGRQSRR